MLVQLTAHAGGFREEKWLGLEAVVVSLCPPPPVPSPLFFIQVPYPPTTASQ